MAGFGFTEFRCRTAASRVSSLWSLTGPLPKPRPPLRGFIQCRGMIWDCPVRAWSLFPAVVCAVAAASGPQTWRPFRTIGRERGSADVRAANGMFLSVPSQCPL